MTTVVWDTPTGGPLAAALARFLAGLPSISDAYQLAEATVAVSGLVGLRTVMAGALLVDGRGPEARFDFGNWPPEWMARYTAEVFVTDPLVVEARRRFVPFTWTELEAEGHLSRDMAAAIAAARANGWQDGFAVPIHGPVGYLGLVSFAGGELDLSAMDRALLLALAHAAHLKGRALAGARESGTSAAALSARELQVMGWVASGKSDWEIGQILGIAESTAHFHVEQAKRKLRVRSRVQAVGILLLSGTL